MSSIRLPTRQVFAQPAPVVRTGGAASGFQAIAQAIQGARTDLEREALQRQSLQLAQVETEVLRRRAEFQTHNPLNAQAFDAEFGGYIDGVLEGLSEQYHPDLIDQFNQQIQGYRASTYGQILGAQRANERRNLIESTQGAITDRWSVLSGEIRRDQAQPEDWSAATDAVRAQYRTLVDLGEMSEAEADQAFDTGVFLMQGEVLAQEAMSMARRAGPDAAERWARDVLADPRHRSLQRSALAEIRTIRAERERQLALLRDEVRSEARRMEYRLTNNLPVEREAVEQMAGRARAAGVPSVAADLWATYTTVDVLREFAAAPFPQQIVQLEIERDPSLQTLPDEAVVGMGNVANERARAAFADLERTVYAAGELPPAAEIDWILRAAAASGDLELTEHVRLVSGLVEEAQRLGNLSQPEALQEMRRAIDDAEEQGRTAARQRQVDMAAGVVRANAEAIAEDVAAYVLPRALQGLSEEDQVSLSVDQRFQLMDQTYAAEGIHLADRRYLTNAEVEALSERFELARQPLDSSVDPAAALIDYAGELRAQFGTTTNRVIRELDLQDALESVALTMVGLPQGSAQQRALAAYLARGGVAPLDTLDITAADITARINVTVGDELESITLGQAQGFGEDLHAQVGILARERLLRNGGKLGEAVDWAFGHLVEDNYSVVPFRFDNPFDLSFGSEQRHVLLPRGRTRADLQYVMDEIAALSGRIDPSQTDGWEALDERQQEIEANTYRASIANMTLRLDNAPGGGFRMVPFDPDGLEYRLDDGSVLAIQLPDQPIEVVERSLLERATGAVDAIRGLFDGAPAEPAELRDNIFGGLDRESIERLRERLRQQEGDR